MQFLTEVKEIEYNDLYKNAILAFIHEEASKLLNRWYLIESDAYFELPDPVQLLLYRFPCAYLSGGFLTKKLHSDYDIFVVGQKEEDTYAIGNTESIFDYCRKKKFCWENWYCLEVKNQTCKNVQVMKRIYKSPDLIIANFDLSIVRKFYRPGKLWTSILCLFEEKTKMMYINMKNNSQNFYSRVQKYGTLYNYFCVFDKQDMKPKKTIAYDAPNVHSKVKNLITGKVNNMRINNGKPDSIETLLLDLTGENFSFHRIFKVRDFTEKIVLKGVEYYYKPENCKEIIKSLVEENYDKYLNIMKLTYVDRYVGAINPKKAKYTNHRKINIFKAFPEILMILRFKLPKYVKVLIVWFYTLALIQNNILGGV